MFVDPLTKGLVIETFQKLMKNMGLVESFDIMDQWEFYFEH